MNGLGVAFLTLGTAAFMMTTIRTIYGLSQLATRVRYRDGLYFVAVRNPGEWHEIREFVQPSNPEVVALYSQIGPDAWSCFDWVCQNISYRRDIGEFWRLPSEVVATTEGDCEDSAILLTSLLRNFTNAYVVLGEYQGWGHAWVSSEEGEMLEATYTQAKPVPDPEDYCPYLLFNDQEVIELWPGALQEVFKIKRDEASKLNLMAAAVET